jgi:hypothetical protein
MVEEKRSFVKRRKRVGDKTAPWETPLLVSNILEQAPSTTADIERLDIYLEINVHIDGGNPMNGNLAIMAACYTLSK